MANTAGNNLVDVEVEFDYVAELADELTIQTGDVIKDVKRMSGGWWEGTFNGKRGLFPDNFVKVISKDGSKTKQLLVGSSTAKDSVQLRSSQKKHGTVAARKKCRVLYSYQPKHEDELELKVDDIVDFDSEVEDGWWKGTLRGQCGVFPSNFVELLRSSVSQTTTTPAPQNDVANEETTTISVADKNKKNEKLKAEKSSSSTSLVSGRISSLIQEAESKTKKKSSENLNLIRRESPVGSENVDKSKSEANAPKLPPKPVKEQCIVLFPYAAVNDDELSLEEGQILNVVTKDVEDKGWWKGEIDGRVGVFPDNFVKLIITPETTSSNSTIEETKPKKPGRPPATNVGKRDSAEESLDSSKNSSREQLNGSPSNNLDRVSSFNKSPLIKNGPRKTSREDKPAPKSSPPIAPSASASAALASGGTVSSPKKHSFGRSTPPPKPKPPAINSTTNSTPNLTTNSTPNSKVKLEDEKLIRDEKRASIKSVDVKEKVSEIIEKSPPASVRETKSIHKMDLEKLPEDDFDTIQRDTEKLLHPTAERVKAPKRRPPSSVFVKDAKLSGDVFEGLPYDSGEIDDPIFVPVPVITGSRSNSQGSLSSLDDLNDKENHLRKDSNSVRHENKNRLSFKLVKQMKEALSGLTNGSNESNKMSEPKEDKSKTKMPPPKPPLPANLINNEAAEAKKEEDKKKPDWLEELSRKQAHRKSGLFSDKAETTSSAITNGTSSKPNVVADKPHLPIKPSQIRDDARKSMVFPKRESSTEKELSPTSSLAPTIPKQPQPVSGFIRQPSKHDLKGSAATNIDSKSRSSISPTNEKSPIVAATEVEKTRPLSATEKSHVTAPTVEKSYLTSTEKLPNDVLSNNMSNDISSKDQPAKNVSSIPSTHFVGGWKTPSPTKEVASTAKTISAEDIEDMTLLERIRRLERTIDEIRDDNSHRFESLQRQLDEERAARIRAETELEIIKRNTNLR